MPQLIAYSIEAPVFLSLAHEALNLTDPGKIVVQKRVHSRRSPTLQAIAAMCCQRVRERAGDEQREWRQRE